MRQLSVLHHLNWAVVITVIAVRMMQMAIDKVVDVVAMRDGFMTAPRTMYVTRIMLPTVMCRRAIVGIHWTYRNCVLFNDTVTPHMMKMSIMQVVYMIGMSNTRVATSWPMHVVVVIMNLIFVSVFNHYYLHHVAGQELNAAPSQFPQEVRNPYTSS